MEAGLTGAPCRWEELHIGEKSKLRYLPHEATLHIRILVGSITCIVPKSLYHHLQLLYRKLNSKLEVKVKTFTMARKILLKESL